MSKAVFLDRDGTLIEEGHYLHKVEDVRIFPEAGSALQLLAQAGFRLIMVTNQSGVGRGYFTMADVEKVHEHLKEEFHRHGVRFDQIYVAPEAPDQPSRGRKPSPQFLFDARDQLGIELGASYMVGDKLIDLECGWNAGVRRSLLVRTGAKTEQAERARLRDAVVVAGLAEAARWALADAATAAG